MEIGGKVGRLLSGGVDTPVEDERRPLFKTSWSRSHCTVQPTLGSVQLGRALALGLERDGLMGGL